MKDLEKMTAEEIFKGLKKIRKHQIHAVKYHPKVCNVLIKEGRRYGKAYKEKLMQKYNTKN
jgi:hypothetical protein